MNINVESLPSDSLAGTTLGTIVPNNGAVRWSEPDQPAGCFSSQVTVHQTNRIVFFSNNKPAGTVFFSQILDQRMGSIISRVGWLLA